MKKLLSVLLIFTLMVSQLVGCRATKSEDEVTEKSNNVSSMDESEEEITKSDEDMFTERDTNADYNEADCVRIELNGSSATSSSDSVKISGGKVTITEEATYIISGSLNDGMIIVDADEKAKLQIVLNGVNITSKTSAALYILEADKVFVTLADGTSNVLANGGTFSAIDDNNIDAVVFSKQDLTWNGSGSLTVTSPAGHGIVCKDDLVLAGGIYTVNSASHGLDANDSVRITGEIQLSIAAGKDGIHCENTEDESAGFIYVSNGTIKMEAEGDGVTASGYVQIENGAFDLLSGGGNENGSNALSENYGEFMGGRGHGGMRPGSLQSTTTEDSGTSMKGIKTGTKLLINGGTFMINSADDALHSEAAIIINGGTFEIASGDDAIHAEENLNIVGGSFDITNSYEGLEALNIDIKDGEIKIVASDDGLNAAGGTDSSGTTGGRDGMYGGTPGGMGGGMSSGNGSIVISGGNLYIKASGDGIDSNGTLTISGGYVVVTGPIQGDTATLDYDKSGIITGGTFIGTGASGMAQTFSDSEQGVIAVSVGNQNAGTNITLKDKNGNTIISYEPELSFAVVILSSPDIQSGETYTITAGAVSGEFEAN